MNMIFRYLFKMHAWFYKGDGTRICMVCGRVEASKTMYQRGEADIKYWKCIKRGNENIRPCGKSYYNRFGLPDRGQNSE